ncbi:MAG: TlyA family RNA methyltransferase [Pseudomonadota bacterium]
MTKRRLDQLLVDRGLAENRTRAQALIMAGLVFSNDKRLDKPGHQIADDSDLDVRGKDHPWVGRGGLKLDHALGHFDLDVTGKTALDLGASTGGFTDVLLTRGAAHVYAVDVGHGQLAWKLREDARVTVLEKTNARDLDKDLIVQPVDVITADLSFISLKTALPASLALAAPGALLVALIKPQFEAGRGEVSKGGIVTDPEVHEAVCRDIESWLSDQPYWQVIGITPSPVTGADGNKEFLIAAGKNG